MEGLALGTGVVGRAVGLGVGKLDGLWLGDGEGINEGLEEGTGVLGSFVGLGDGIIEGLVEG